MRAGACTVQQALTPNAAAVVKQAVSLARRRGNPQVTPLHVASAMLLQQGAGSSSSSGLLHAACLRSHSLPLQCRALELYFNVALNRLPTSTSPLLGPAHVYSYPPSLSNAFVAAFKRAQAHQRRGSADAQQQQPVLAVKIELEQLVISILDDPSVSRVMREAGFSCAQVKANVEQAVSSVEGDSLALSLNCVDDSAIRAKCGDRSRNGSSRCLSLREAAGSSGELTAVDSTFCDEFSAEKCEAVKRFPRSNIPHWLQHCRDHQEIPHSKKWSLTNGGSPSQRTTLNLSTVVSPSSSVSSYEKKQWRHYQNQPYQPWLLADVHDANHHAWKANSGKQVHIINDVDVKIVRAIKVKSNDSSASNGSVEEVQCRSRFKELSAQSLKALCSALEKEVPWQADMVPEIASTVLRCRSGMTRRSRRDADASTPASANEDTWLLFLGGDTEGKARVARELASLVFGSRKRFVSISAAASSPARSDSTEQRRQQGSKRPRPASCSLDRLYETVRDDPHRVLVLEDVEQADRLCQLGIRESIERGWVRSHGGDEAALGDAIVILSCESFDARSRASSPPLMTKKAKLESEKEIKEEDTEDHHGKEAIAAPTSASSSFDLNMSVQKDDMEDSCFTDGGLVKAVDRAFFFRRLDETSD